MQGVPHEPVALFADRLLPLLFDVGVDPHRDAMEPPAPLRQPDQPRPLVGRIYTTNEIAQALQLPKQVVDGLLADLGSGREVTRPHAVRARPPKKGDVRRPQIGEPGCDHSRVDPGPHLIDRESEESPDR